MTEVPGFEDCPLDNDPLPNPKIKKIKKGSGGFQSMDLSHNVLKGILKRGYQQPTPIQRKAIPIVLQGRDVVAMARTGSGKTACFLIPLFERLKARSAKKGARALILSPTRELALQTLNFIKQIGRFVGLQAAVILGGDPMDEQFSALHGNPDIIVATPGRFLHVCIEMDLRLDSVQYVVFDEADRLFEMGLAEQLTDIVHRLPDRRQTVLFSATLPKVLVEFARAGLSDPVLVRLDVETKIPPELQLVFLTVRQEEKIGGLLVLLKSIIDSEQQQTIVFAATKHHVEYIHSMLKNVNIKSTYIYSNLDASARKQNITDFSTKKANVLVVTDIAARGIDIPHLDNVINYNFPGKPKLFVHRVGRCARAGRSGTAYSLVGADEYAHLLDLHLFLGRPLKVTTAKCLEGTFGRIPQNVLEEQLDSVKVFHKNNHDLDVQKSTSEKGYLHYIRTRPTASVDSNKRVKYLPLNSCLVHPIFHDLCDASEEKRQIWLDEMKKYRPNGTVFEICTKTKSTEYQIMKEKRHLYKDTIKKFHETTEEKLKQSMENIQMPISLTESNNLDVKETFKDVILPKKRKLDSLYNRKSKLNRGKDDVFIPYAPEDQHTEDGLAINNFQTEATKAQMDLIADSEETRKQWSQVKKWDRKKKKMVGVQDKRVGKIRTESGVWIPSSFKSQRYAEWKERSKFDANRNDSDDDNDNNEKNGRKVFKQSNLHTHWARHNRKMQEKQQKSEKKTYDQILKKRVIADKRKQREKRIRERKMKKKSKGRKKK